VAIEFRPHQRANAEQSPETARISGEFARALDDAVNRLVSPAMPAYFRSSVVNRRLNFILILFSQYNYLFETATKYVK
jgi:hypothetical protein